MKLISLRACACNRPREPGGEFIRQSLGVNPEQKLYELHNSQVLASERLV